MAFSPETYALCLKNTAERIDEALTSVYNYKGSVDTIADLPLTNNKVGDTYDVKSEGGQNYGWNGESWDSLGVNREATDTDLGLIKKKDNTFNTTTFVGDMTAINSDNTSITGSGITSINGEGNFEVSKPTTILASKTNNIAGEVVNITPSSSMNITAKNIHLTSVDGHGITMVAHGEPITLTGNVVIDSGFGVGTTYINTDIITKDLKANNLTTDNVDTRWLSTTNYIRGQNYGGSTAEKVSPLISATGAKNNIVLGAYNTFIGDPGYPVSNTENIIIGRNNEISSVAANDFVIGQSNVMDAKYSTILGFYNRIEADYSLVKGQWSNIYALGVTAFGSKNNTTNSAEFGLVSGFGNTLNGKVSAVLGDNLRGSTETGSMTIGTFNEKKDAMFVVGNGNQSSSSVITRSNAFEVYKNGDAVIQNNLTVGGTINLSSLKNIPVWTLDDIQESDEPVNIFKYFLGDGYNDFTTCNRWFIVMPQIPRQFFIGHKSKQGVTLNLSSLGEMHLLYFIKSSEKWTITLYNITGKLNESSTKSIPTIEVRSFVEDESGNFSALTTIPTFVTSVSGMMDADYNPSSDRHIITMKYLNTRIQELLDNEISSKITEELNKINVAENKN